MLQQTPSPPDTVAGANSTTNLLKAHSRGRKQEKLYIRFLSLNILKWLYVTIVQHAGYFILVFLLL